MNFTYRNPARSTDPSATLPGARSLVVGCLSYAREPPAAPGPGASSVTASVARYAWVDHYRTLRLALEKVAAALEDRGWRARILIDDNALVDRAAAVRAGLGWYGKNCNVLVPGSGSWVVLGSVVTDALLAGGHRPIPVRDGCGACHRCIDDCPTGALVAPGVLDARRCLSWLLQAPGVFPAEYRVALGDRIYGCDGCQEACPVNRRAGRAGPAPPAEDASQAGVDVVALLLSSDAEIVARVGRWYIPDRDVGAVRRNALVVLGNVGEGGDPLVASALRGSLGHADPVVRAHAVWAAGRLGRRDLLEPILSDADPLVRTELESLDATPPAAGVRAG